MNFEVGYAKEKLSQKKVKKTKIVRLYAPEGVCP